MADSESRTDSGKSGWKGCLVTAGVAGVILLAMPVIVYFVWSAAASRRVTAQLAEIRAKGEPTTAQELDAYYTLPGGADSNVKDTTQLLLAALGPLTSKQFSAEAAGLPVVGRESTSTIPPLDEDWPEQAEVEQLLEKYGASMRQLHEAADQGAAARFDLKFQDGFAMLLEHAQNLRQAARMLKLEAYVRAHRGDAEGTVDSLTTGYRIARCLDREPSIVSQLVNIAVRSVALQSIQDLVPQMEFTDEQLKRLQETIREADFSEQMRHGLVGERALAIEAFRDPSGMVDASSAQQVAVGPRNDDLSLYLELMTPLIDSMDQPWPTQRAAAKKSTQEIQARTSGPLSRLRYLLTSLLFPAMEAALDAQARTAAHRDLVDCQLAVQRYELEHGSPPAQLADLVPAYLPAVPTDPFDGKPLRYAVDPREVRIYSIGRDEQDDGGQGDETMEPDVVVRLPLDAS